MRNSRLMLRAEADAARAWQAFAPVSFLHGCEALCPGPPESDQRRLSATHVARPLVGAGCGASTDAPGVDEPGVKAAAPPAVEPDSEKVAQCTEAFNELTYLKLSRDDDDDEDGVDESFKVMCMMSALAALKTNTTVKSLWEPTSDGVSCVELLRGPVALVCVVARGPRVSRSAAQCKRCCSRRFKSSSLSVSSL